jgi:hypothetical protein
VREKSRSAFRATGRDHGGQHHGAPAADDDGAVGLFGDLAGFDRECVAVELGLYGMARHEINDPPAARRGTMLGLIQV